MKKLTLIIVSLLLIASAYAYTKQQQQQPVLEPEIEYINHVWDQVLQTPSLIDELQEHDPDLVYHLVVENDKCTSCKCRVLLWCYSKSTNWDDTVGESCEADELLDNIIMFCYGEL